MMTPVASPASVFCGSPANVKPPYVGEADPGSCCGGSMASAHPFLPRDNRRAYPPSRLRWPILQYIGCQPTIHVHRSGIFEFWPLLLLSVGTLCDVGTRLQHQFETVASDILPGSALYCFELMGTLFLSVLRVPNFPTSTKRCTFLIGIRQNSCLESRTWPHSQPGGMYLWPRTLGQLEARRFKSEGY